MAANIVEIGMDTRRSTARSRGMVANSPFLFISACFAENCVSFRKRRRLPSNLETYLTATQSSLTKSAGLGTNEGNPGGVMDSFFDSLSASSMFSFSKKARISSFFFMS